MREDAISIRNGVVFDAEAGELLLPWEVYEQVSRLVEECSRPEPDQYDEARWLAGCTELFGSELTSEMLSYCAWGRTLGKRELEIIAYERTEETDAQLAAANQRRR